MGRCDRSILGWTYSPPFDDSRISSSSSAKCLHRPNNTKRLYKAIAIDLARSAKENLPQLRYLFSSVYVSPQRKPIVLPGEHASQLTTQPRLQPVSTRCKFPRPITRRQGGILLIDYLPDLFLRRRKPRPPPDIPDPKVPQHDTRQRALCPRPGATHRPQEPNQRLHRPV